MLLILELECGSQITIFDDGTVLLPDLSGDAIALPQIEEIVAEIRRLSDFQNGRYMLKADHLQAVANLNQKLKKARRK